MKLWTIQPLEVWEELNKKGYFICDPQKSYCLKDSLSFKNAYDWLSREMEYRIGHRPKGVIYPIWAWHTRDWQHKKPDLRNIGLGDKGVKSVCIEIEIPDNQVVLTDFDSWHYVLNEWYYDGSTCEKEWELLRSRYDGLSSEKQKVLREKSWQNIFDISPYKNDWFQKGRYIQATFWVLYLKDVKKVQYFIAR